MTTSEIVRAWLLLSWLDKVNLAKRLGLWKPGDGTLSDEDLAVLTRARDHGLLDKLAQEACQMLENFKDKCA